MNLKMKGWVQDRLEEIPSSKAFTLFHCSIDGLSDLVLKVPVEKEIEELEAEAERIVTTIHEHARMHVEAFEGQKQRYKVAAETESDLVGQFSFSIGSAIKSADVGLSEPATEKGLLGQLMRHNDRKDAFATDAINAVLGPIVTENQSLRKQRDDFERSRIDAFVTLQELLDRKLERDLILQEFETGKERKDKFVDALIEKWGPEIIKRFQLGGKQSPALETSNGNTVQGYQSALREIFRMLDKQHLIFASLDGDDLELLNSLLGLGDEPDSIDSFKSSLRKVWSVLPESITENITNTLTEKDPQKAKAFLMLMEN